MPAYIIIEYCQDDDDSAQEAHVMKAKSKQAALKKAAESLEKTEVKKAKKEKTCEAGGSVFMHILSEEKFDFAVCVAVLTNCKIRWHRIRQEKKGQPEATPEARESM